MVYVFEASNYKVEFEIIKSGGKYMLFKINAIYYNTVRLTNAKFFAKREAYEEKDKTWKNCYIAVAEENVPEEEIITLFYQSPFENSNDDFADKIWGRFVANYSYLVSDEGHFEVYKYRMNPLNLFI